MRNLGSAEMGDGDDETQTPGMHVGLDIENTKPLKATAASTFMVKDVEPVKPVMLRPQFNQDASKQMTIQPTKNIRLAQNGE